MIRSWTSTVMAMGMAVGCSTDPDPLDGFTEAEWAKIATFSPMPKMEPDPTNRYADNPLAATFGQRLFFEKGFSGSIAVGDDGTNGGLGAVGEIGKVSCASCHEGRPALDDVRSRPNHTSLGTAWTPRHTPPLPNTGFYDFFGWGGQWDSLWMMADVYERPVMAGNRLAFAHTLYRKYRADYDAIFPIPLDPALDPAASDAARFPPAGKPKKPGDPDGPWEMMTAADRTAVNTMLVNVGKALAAYQRMLVSDNAPFDRYVAGDATAISASAKRGLRLFIGKAACDGCHKGALFSDHQFHNTGVLQAGGPYVPATDEGAFADLTRMLASPFTGVGPYSDDIEAGRVKLAKRGAPTVDDKGKFRTKSLRSGVAESGPYMHNGRLATLEEVVDFYNRGGEEAGFSGTKDPLMKPLNLTAGEVSDLVEFLKSLTGEPVAPELSRDTSAP